jgi:hypothetical protein
MMIIYQDIFLTMNKKSWTLNFINKIYIFETITHQSPETGLLLGDVFDRSEGWH